MDVIGQVKDFLTKKKGKDLKDMSDDEKKKTAKANPFNTTTAVMQIRDRAKQLKDAMGD